MADSQSATKTLEAKCSCGAVHLTVDVPVSTLPLLVHLCHCSLCRYSAGVPSIFHTDLPTGVVPKFVEPSSEANMTRYAGPTNHAHWCFCSTCGCHISAVGIEKGNWTISTSIFTDHSPETFRIGKHIFSKSAKDGGIAKLLKQIHGREFIDNNPPDGSPEAQIIESKLELGKNGEERLRAKCHCGGVSFTIPRPTQEVLQDKFMSGFVSHRDNTKWVATFDACDDCRLVNGTHLIGWMFFPLALCDPPIKPDLLIGTAKTYCTSPGVLRSFCGTCGATFFYTSDDRRPTDEQQVVDLSTGVLRAPEGVMAENWLTWRARIGWADSGKRFDSAFVEALQKGMNEWVMETQHEVRDYEIG